jgi:deoxycytidylate deaminase
MLHRFLEMAKRFAAHHQYERNMEYRLCAVLVKGGKSISVGYNKRTRSELMRRFAIRDHQTVHAEVDAVLQVRRKIDLTGCKIYVVRLLKNGNTAIARPCGTCQEVLKAYGIKTMVYTTDNGWDREEVYND